MIILYINRDHPAVNRVVWINNRGQSWSQLQKHNSLFFKVPGGVHIQYWGGFHLGICWTRWHGQKKKFLRNKFQSQFGPKGRVHLVKRKNVLQVAPTLSKNVKLFCHRKLWEGPIWVFFGTITAAPMTWRSGDWKPGPKNYCTYHNREVATYNRDPHTVNRDRHTTIVTSNSTIDIEMYKKILMPPKCNKKIQSWLF